MNVATEVAILPGFRLRENIWHVDPDADAAYVRTTDETFGLSRQAALAFLQMRPYCTGHHSATRIAELSGMRQADVEAVLDGLSASGILLAPGSNDLVRDRRSGM
jgi:DNA-binding MarR family transcriptional regulator